MVFYVNSSVKKRWYPFFTLHNRWNTIRICHRIGRWRFDLQIRLVLQMRMNVRAKKRECRFFANHHFCNTAKLQNLNGPNKCARFGSAFENLAVVFVRTRSRFVMFPLPFFFFLCIFWSSLLPCFIFLFAVSDAIFYFLECCYLTFL